MEGLIAINGRVVERSEDAKISVLDRGFLVGDHIFEVMVAFGPKILDLPAHLSRLRDSARAAGMPLPWSDEDLTRELTALTQRLNAIKTYLRLSVTRGEGFGIRTSDSLQPNKIVFAFPAKVENKAVYEKGLSLKLCTSNFVARGPAPKTSHYLSSIVALNAATAEGYDDILWENAAGEITEAATANVFFLGRHGDLVEVATPAPESGLLLGITRGRIIQLLRKSGIPVTERVIMREELARFDEAFLTSTVRGLVPVNRIDQHRLHTRRANSTFQHLERLYLTWVESEIGYRVNWNTGLKAATLQ